MIDLKLIFREMWEFWSDISTSTNKSRPGTLFKMCSRSWEYWRFQYHQKLLTQNRSCGLSKIWNLLFDLFWGDPHNPPIHQKKILEISLRVWLKIEVWPYQRHWHIPRDRVSPSTRTFPGFFLLDGISLDPTSRRKFPGSFPPDVEKKV